jgi:TPR repeat protein
MGRLGRAYREGRGVEQNPEKAAEWMRKAAGKNVGWAQKELLLIIGNKKYV